MTAAVGDSIRSMIGKTKKENAGRATGGEKRKPIYTLEKKETRGQRINGSADEPSYGLRGPRSRSWRSISSGVALRGSLGGG